MECKLINELKLGLHTQFIGEILDIKADEECLSEKRKPDIRKVDPILYGSFGSSNYYSVGEELGKAFSIGKKLKK